MKAIHHLKNHLLKSRESIIIASVLVSIISSSLLSSISLDFTTHYITGFTRSLLLSALLYCAINITASVRIFTIMILAFVSMSLDVLYLMSPDNYGYIFQFRYEHKFSFSNIYSTIEIIALLYGGRNIAIRFMDGVCFSRTRFYVSKSSKGLFYR